MDSEKKQVAIIWTCLMLIIAGAAAASAWLGG